MRRGIWYAVAAYATWGLFPLYWHALASVPAAQLVCHRIVWSFALLAVILLLTRTGRALLRSMRSPRVLGIYAVAAVLISINWFTYIWGVNAGFVVETSLGYFINPLVSVLLGVVFLRERLRRFQWAAIAIAGCGVLYLGWTYGSVPWIAITLATTFAVYGLVKKLAPLGSLPGLALETGLLFLPALGYLLYASGGTVLPHTSTAVDALLVGAGVVTTVPLLLFASASRRVPLLYIGVLQYIQPTMQFLLGVLVFHEAMTAQRFVGFGIVWLALAVFGIEGVLAHRARPFPATTD